MTLRNLLMVAVLAATGVLLAGQVRQLLADPTVWPPDDFVEYWAAAKLTLNGQNPFDESLLLPLQQTAGRDTPEAIMMWNPPWALPAVLPLGLLPAREAQLLWLLVHLVVTGLCADRLWLMLGGNPARRWVGWVVAFVFLPTVFALSSGQISPFLLLGAVLFLECLRRGGQNPRWEYLAGAATVLVAIKPHLAYLLWVGIAIDALARGRWRVLVGGALTGIVCAVLPLAFNPQVWNQYIYAMTHRTPEQWLMPTIGTLLRLAYGHERFWLQFVPVAIGLVWFVWYRWRNRNDWNWREQLPPLLLVSFITTPYGAWPFDMVLLLPVMFVMLVPAIGRRVTVPLSESSDSKESDMWHLLPPAETNAATPGSILTGWVRLPVVGLVAVNLGCLAMNLGQTGSFWFLWVSPALVLLYAVHMRKSQVIDAPRFTQPVAVTA